MLTSRFLQTFTAQHNVNRIQQNLQVHPEGHVFQVEEVILQFFLYRLDIGGVSDFYLSPSGDAGPDFLAADVKRDHGFELVYEVRAFRSWSDQAHFPFQDVPELWNLVNSRRSDQAADSGDARVFLFCPARSGYAFRVVGHRPEFVHLEFFAVLADPGLSIEHGPAGFQSDGESEKNPDRQKDNQNKRRDDDIHDSFYRAFPFRHKLRQDIDQR